jgi:diphthine-ammonia ligase
MKVVALVSGGKDSCYAMMECVRFGHEIVCLAHLHPPSELAADDAEIDSFMFQSVGHQSVALIAQSMELPLVSETITGTAVKMEIDYHESAAGDEVEDLYRLLEKVKQQFPGVEGVCTGAIFSSYQRNRVENVCVQFAEAVDVVGALGTDFLTAGQVLEARAHVAWIPVAKGAD